MHQDELSNKFITLEIRTVTHENRNVHNRQYRISSDND